LTKIFSPGSVKTNEKETNHNAIWANIFADALNGFDGKSINSLPFVIYENSQVYVEQK
jgi:hypothetical protein